MTAALPSQADVVIVGRGIAGCSIVYHLTKIGITDVVLPPGSSNGLIAGPYRRPGLPA